MKNYQNIKLWFNNDETMYFIIKNFLNWNYTKKQITEFIVDKECFGTHTKDNVKYTKLDFFKALKDFTKD